MKLRVTYAKSSYKGKVYRTPLVQYSYRDEKGTPRHKTVLSLTKLPEYVVKVIDEALKRGDTSVLNDYVPKKDIHYQKSIPVGAVVVAFAILTQLCIVELLNKFLDKGRAFIVIAFIIERIIAEKPLSVSALYRQMPDSPTHFLLGAPPVPYLNKWYDAFAELEKARPKILTELWSKNTNTDRVFLYDITSSYFEGDKCPLAYYGYNRDGKKGKKQVVIGVICDSEGRPIWCDVFNGNTTDQMTVKQQLKNLKDTLGVKEFTIVGDRGMITNARISELEKEGWWETFSYITALKRSELLGLIDDVDHPMQAELFAQKQLREIEHNGERFVLCHNPKKREEDRQVRERLLAKTEEKLKMIERNVVKGRLKREDKILKRVYRWINHWKMERFFEIEYGEGHFSFKRKEGEIERFSAIDGCYVIRSNVANSETTKEELRTQYKDLKYVEQTFRTMKTTDLNLRPIRVWNEEHVRGYIFGCFLAYRATWEIRRRLQSVLALDGKRRLRESLQEIYRNLTNITVGILEIGGKIHLKISDISSKNRNILKCLKIPEISSMIRQKV